MTIPAQRNARERVTDRCGFCPAATTTVVVTVNGWVHNACQRCATALVDPLFARTAL